MRLTEQTVNRLKKLAGLKELDSKSPQHIALKKGKGDNKFKPLPPQPQPTGSNEIPTGSNELCTDPNWINFPDGDPIGGPNYSWFKYDYCDRCGHNMSNVDPAPASGPMDVPAYIGFGAAPSSYLDDQITWNIGPPMGAEIDFGSASSVSLGNFCPCCVEVEEGEGCTDSTADNYDPEATVDDGSCLIEMFMCINCEVVSLGMVPLYEDAMDWSSFNPDSFGGSGTYSLGYLYPWGSIENDYFSLNGQEIYNGNMETCGIDSLFPIISYPELAFSSCPDNPYSDG